MIAGLILAASLAGPAAAKDRVKRWASELDGADLPRQIVAARVLGRLGKPEGVEPLLGRLDVKRASPRLTAAIVASLGQLRDPRALEPLTGVWDYLNSARLQLGSDNLPASLQTLRAAVVEAVGELGDKRAAPLLEEAVNDKDSAVAQKAALALAKIHDTMSVDALLQMLPRGGNSTQAAAEALGRLGDPRGTAALQNLLKSDDRNVPIEAAYGLALHDKTQIKTLQTFMRDDKRDTEERLLAAYYLARLNDGAGLDFLGHLAEKARQSGDQEHAIEALGKTENPRAAPWLLEAGRSPDANVRLLVTQALGRLGGSKAETGLKRLEEDHNPTVKAAARAALDELGQE